MGSVAGLVEVQVVPPYCSDDPAKDSRVTTEDTPHAKSTSEGDDPPVRSCASAGFCSGRSNRRRVPEKDMPCERSRRRCSRSECSARRCHSARGGRSDHFGERRAQHG